MLNMVSKIRQDRRDRQAAHIQEESKEEEDDGTAKDEPEV